MWKAWSKAVAADQNLFMSNTLYEYFALLVYGIKGVAMQLPPGCAMNQRNGKTDDLEHEFATTRHKNPNPTLAEARCMLAKQTGHRVAKFHKEYEIR